jgi:hypothetical protein
MDLQLFVNVIGVIALPVLGWIGGLFWRQIAAAKKEAVQAIADLAAFKLHVAEHYLKRDEFKEVVDDMKDRILRELDGVDKKIGVLFEKIDRLI